MAINATNKSKPREVIPASNYMARCYSMVHMGTCLENINGEDKEINKVKITWELPTEKRVFSEEKGEQPMVISKDYTLSMHEKSNLRKDLESWRGKGFTQTEAEMFDITKLLGLPCMLNIIHKTSKSSGNTYAAISGITKIPKEMNCPEQINPTFEFNFDNKYDLDVLNAMPDFIKDRIKKSVEFNNLINPENTQIDLDDDLPASESLTIDDAPEMIDEEPLF